MNIDDVAVGVKHDVALTQGPDEERRYPHTPGLPAVYEGKGTLPPVYSEDSVDVPTIEELHTLRRVRDHIPWKAYTVAFVELCERFSYYGTTVVCMRLSTFPFLAATLLTVSQSPTSSNSHSQPDHVLVLGAQRAKRVLSVWVNEHQLELAHSISFGSTARRSWAHMLLIPTWDVLTPFSSLSPSPLSDTSF